MKIKKGLVMMVAVMVIFMFSGVMAAAQKTQEGTLVTADGTHLFYEETQNDTGEPVWRIYGVFSDGNVIRIPETIEGKKVYELCQNAIASKDTVEEIYLPENMKVIASDQFSDCVSLKKVYLGGVQKFSGRWDEGASLFWYCSKLESFSMGDSASFPIEATGYNGSIKMFYADILNNLKYIRIGSSMKNVAENLFYGKSLERVEIGANNPLYRGINGVVYSADGKTLLVCGTAYPDSFYEIPAGVEEISEIGFSECKNIKKLKVPSTVCRGTLRWGGTSGITLQVEKYSYAYLYAVQTGAAYELYGNPQPHTHRYETVVDKAATCATPGIQHDVCTDCLESGGSVVIPATGAHTYGEYVTIVPPTSSETGTAVRTCSVCGASETKVLNKLPGQTGGKKQNGAKSSGSQKVVQNQGSDVYQGRNNGTGVNGTGAGNSVSENVFGLKKQISLTAGKSVSLKPKVGGKKVTYWSSNKKIVTVTPKGVLKGLKTGSAIITVKAGGKKAAITVKVTAPAAKNITNVPKKKTLKKGKSFTIKPNLSPKGSIGKITFTSSDRKVATVSAKGKVIAKEKGTAVITVKTGKIKVKCKVKVK